ncbi:MAG: EAL domain-containing protein, partial [Pseudomonadota bacterium]
TETVAVRSPEKVKARISKARDLGVSFAIDDFGIGESSLGTLKNFPFDKLKLDRAFIRELDMGDAELARAVVTAIVALGRALNMRVLAEGVETEEQLTFLKSVGCELAQGYLFGKPEAKTLGQAQKSFPLKQADAA